MELKPEFDRREHILRMGYVRALRAIPRQNIRERLECKRVLDKTLKELCKRYRIKDLTAYLSHRGEVLAKIIAGKRRALTKN